jgi:hypothetical protein
MNSLAFRAINHPLCGCMRGGCSIEKDSASFQSVNRGLICDLRDDFCGHFRPPSV